MPMRKKLLGLLASLSCACASAQMVQVADLADLSLEQLATLSVTTASRRTERLVEAPASIFVVTQEDIRRAGVTSLYEAMRLAPNLHVVRGDANQYIASARGGLAGTANKMLVLVDGRTVYSPLFSGVFSDAQFAFLEDVERIEVISGPGSTLWGTNAVNGVVNVITKSSARTAGPLASAVAGEDERGVSARYGAPLGNGDVRAYVRYQQREQGRLASGAGARDEAERTLAGVRYDRHGEAGSATTWQAEVYRADVDNLGGFRPLSGARLLARHRKVTAGGDWFVQAYFDRSEREHTGTFWERRDTLDFEAQRAIVHGSHRFVWGGGYRHSRDDTANTPALAFLPEDRTLRLASLFAQGTVQAAPALQATFGVRAERNDYTGLEWLPNARATWRLADDQVLWGALTRTVRSPSRIDRELLVPGMPPYALVPGDFRSEIAKVAELGWRARPWPGATLSLTAFHHDFERLRTARLRGGELQFVNGGEGRLHGLEGWLDYTVMRDWRLVGGFVFMRDRYRLQPGHVDTGGAGLGNDPSRIASLRSQWNVARAWDIDLAVRHVGALPSPAVPAYTVLDLSVAWRPMRAVELRLNVANVADRVHREFGTPAVGAVYGRSAWLKVTWAP